MTKLLTSAQLNSYRLGNFALTQDHDGGFRVQNVRTGTKTRPFACIRRAVRVLRAAAKDSSR